MAISVLVVEDSRTQLMRLRADLTSYGFHVLSARDGVEALAVARKDAPDVILSDVLMPGMDGFRFCHEIQLDPSLREIPVVLRTTAFVSDEDRKFALSVGAQGYIDKEVSASELAALLNRVVEGTATHRAADIESDDFHENYQDRLLTRLVEEASHLEQVNEELRDSRGQLQAILDHSPTFIYVKDCQGKHLVANAHFKTLGLDPRSLIGRTTAEIFGPEYSDALRANDQRVIEGGTALHAEEIVPAPDGPHTVWSAKFPLRNAEGEITAISGVSMDITERTRMEHRLRQAERLEALGRLSGGVAHDFNNLLTIISNYATFVSEDLPSDDPLRDDVAQVQAAAERGASLVRQLLAFGGRKQTAEAVDLNAAIGGMESLLRVSAGGRVDLHLDLGSEVPTVAVDPTNVDQLMLNLVSNARDAMPDGGALKISTASSSLTKAAVIGGTELAPGTYATLSVSDTGTGMSAETLARLFEPFFTKKEQGKGTGLGLSTVHGIVHSAGGAIDVRSREGEGTTFTIWLPEARAVSEDEDQSKAPPPSVSAHPTILVVDDERSIREIIQRTLEGRGCDLLLASSGEEAMRIYEENSSRIDLVLSDIRMRPGISGVDLAESLKARDPALRILHISGSDFSIRGALRKPFTGEELIRFIEDGIGRAIGPADAG